MYMHTVEVPQGAPATTTTGVLKTTTSNALQYKVIAGIHHRTELSKTCPDTMHHHQGRRLLAQAGTVYAGIST
jgi:hypothetical protein